MPPAHVHQLNGVAERPIRSIMEQVRVNLVASNLSIFFWAFAAQHSVDVLNRPHHWPARQHPRHLRGDARQAAQGHEHPALRLPRARRQAQKEFVRKGSIDEHAWVGANLGRSSSSPGAYSVWVPSTGHVHTSSDIYFTERLFPHRASNDQFVGPDLPAAAAVDASQPPGIPAPPLPPPPPRRALTPPGRSQECALRLAASISPPS